MVGVYGWVNYMQLLFSLLCFQMFCNFMQLIYISSSLKILFEIKNILMTMTIHALFYNHPESSESHSWTLRRGGYSADMPPYGYIHNLLLAHFQLVGALAFGWLHILIVTQRRICFTSNFVSKQTSSSERVCNFSGKVADSNADPDSY